MTCPSPRPPILGYTEHDVATIAHREGAEVVIAYRRAIEEMPATKHEVASVTREGVQIMACVAPVSAVAGRTGAPPR